MKPLLAKALKGEVAIKRCFLRFILSTLGSPLFLSFVHAEVDESKLWLPQKYQKHYVGLLKAAGVAEKVERCESIIEGTIDIGQTTAEHPMFRILCRQENGRSYNEIIDGLSFDPLTTPWPKELLMSEEELEQLRREEEQKRRDWIDELKREFWTSCKNAAQVETRFMHNMSWLTVEQNEPVSVIDTALEFGDQGDTSELADVAEGTAGDPQESLGGAAKTSSADESGEQAEDIGPSEPLIEVIFAIDFDATDMNGKLLRYQALCSIDNQRQPQIDIKRREIQR